ncbi:hypothetical protein GEMRC1_011951 [Eukaryota sp. GEM-RC1]
MCMKLINLNFHHTSNMSEEVPEVPVFEEQQPVVVEFMVISNDDMEFNISWQIAEESETIKRLTAASPNETISLPEVAGSHLKKSIEWMEWSQDIKKKEKNDVFIPMAVKEQFKDDFVDVDIHELADLLKAAHYLGMEDMQDTCAKKFADYLRPMSVEQMRELFGEPDDLSPEKKAAFEEDHKKLIADEANDH